MSYAALFAKKNPQMAHIRADECIGCTKCIQACPFDAILGAARYLHTVLEAACTGCGLCVAPCPVDCIEMLPVSQLVCSPEAAKQRVSARKQRLRQAKQSAEAVSLSPSITEQQAYIQAAVERVKRKKTVIQDSY